MATSQLDNKAQLSSYLTAATTTTTAIHGGNDTPILCDIKLLCTQRKKKSKRYTYLTFVESCPLLSSSSNEQPCIEIIDKTNPSSILFNDCISLEYFDTIKNDFQSFIYIYFESYTISIYFSDELLHKKPLIIKHLEYMDQKRTEKSNENSNRPSSQDLPCLSTTEHILHTFDMKLMPYETILTRNHQLIGPARIYFTTTDLYIASQNCNRMDLRTIITNQCPSKEKDILCIPYFTIKHYGNRANIFLIELGRSNYGNGEIHMKCQSSSLASTIHLLVSPVIEERPVNLSSAFQNQLLTNKRIEKSKHLQPPIQLNHETTNQSILFNRKPSIESLPERSNIKKSRSIFGFLRKFVQNTNSLQRSCTFDVDPHEQIPLSTPNTNKFFELNIDQKQFSNRQTQINVPKSQIINHEISSNKQDTTIGTYIDMGPTVQNQDEEIKEVEIIKEPTATVDIGVNTIISLSPHVRSAIIVGTTVHLIAEERDILSIGQRSFTSPASILQPFKAQLTGQTNISDSSNSFHQSLFLSYGIVTINQTESTSDGSAIDHRLNSDLSLMSLTHQQQPANIYSFDNILSSSSSSHIFRTLSLSRNNVGDNTSGHIIFFEENLLDQTTSYLLGSPPPTTTLTEETNLKTSISRLHLTHIDEGKHSLNDSYALTEPLNLPNLSVSSRLPVVAKSSSSSEKTINYTDLILPSNTGDEEEEVHLSDEHDLLEEKNDQSSTIFYTDIDFHQIQRRDRIAQFAAISKTNDQIPPFVL